MTLEENNKVIQTFYDSIPANISDKELVERIARIPDAERRSLIAKETCDYVIDLIAYIFYGWCYPENRRLSELPIVKEKFHQLLPYISVSNQNYYNAVSAFFNGENDTCLRLLKKDLDTRLKEKCLLDESWFAYNYLIFKGSIPKLYDYLSERIRSEQYEKGMPEIIRAAKTYYCSNDTALLEKDASAALEAAPDSIIAMELMAEVWWANHKWNNVIAALEEIENGYIYPEHDRLYMLGYSKNKLKDRKGAIESFQKSLAINPGRPWTRLILADIYFSTGQYQDAEKEYRQCIDEKMNLKYACAGYVRTLAARGQFREADEFIKNAPEKIYKYALDELEAVRKGKKEYRIQIIEAPEEEAFSTVKDNSHKPIWQFSREKVFEDELEARLSVGSSIFGIPLKIFKRKGIYGRQWQFEVGRIDLLAEDSEGNLYVIELKKDKGYDDAYAQTVRYVEWFAKSKLAKGKNVFGIICVNNPPQKLIDAVRKDKRIRLFEYQISYSEIL